MGEKYIDVKKKVYVCDHCHKEFRIKKKFVEHELECKESWRKIKQVYEDAKKNVGKWYVCIENNSRSIRFMKITGIEYGAVGTDIIGNDLWDSLIKVSIEEYSFGRTLGIRGTSMLYDEYYDCIYYSHDHNRNCGYKLFRSMTDAKEIDESIANKILSLQLSVSDLKDWNSISSSIRNLLIEEE